MITNIKQETDFNPILFLMPLGAGGISIALWVFLNASIEKAKGMVVYNEVHTLGLSTSKTIFYSSIELLSLLFALLHFITLFYLLHKYFKWDNKKYDDFINNPMKNSSIMGIFLAIDMSFNVIFALGNYFIFQNGPLFNIIMAPALIAWIILFYFTINFSIKILKSMFTKEFNIDKMHFGFLIHPFALSMLAVTGFGIAAFAKNFIISSTAFFLALIPLTVSILLTLVKIITMFQHHMKNKLPDRNFLPSTLIVIPIIMLINLSFFRIGHYLNHQMDAQIGITYFMFVIVIPWAFITWYAIFGLTLIKDYFKNFQEFNPTQWAFICPIAAYAVLGYFVSMIWFNTWMPINYYLLIITLFGVFLYINLLLKQIKVLQNKN